MYENQTQAPLVPLPGIPTVGYNFGRQLERYEWAIRQTKVSFVKSRKLIPTSAVWRKSSAPRMITGRLRTLENSVPRLIGERERERFCWSGRRHFDIESSSQNRQMLHDCNESPAGNSTIRWTYFKILTGCGTRSRTKEMIINMVALNLTCSGLSCLDGRPLATNTKHLPVPIAQEKF